MNGRLGSHFSSSAGLLWVPAVVLVVVALWFLLVTAGFMRLVSLARVEADNFRMCPSTAVREAGDGGGTSTL